MLSKLKATSAKTLFEIVLTDEPRISSNYFKDNVANGTDQIRWKTIEHDILDRPESITMPNNGVTQFTYDLLTTTTTNALGQDHVVTKNILGKPKTSTDNGGTTQFAYDVRGNLLETTDVDSNQIVNTYDHYGRKKTMLDPDMGNWVYAYDAFGQLASQTDANSEVVSMEYDDLGRMTQRDEREGITTWNYDTAANGLGKLESVAGPLSTQSMEYDNLGRPNKSTLTTSGQTYITETGYQGVTGKVDWVKYPTGLVVRKRFDDYGFPVELESVDLQKYQTYRTELDKANNHYREAKILQEQYNDEYEELKAIVQPYYDRINTAQNNASPLLDLVSRSFDKESQHYDLATDYYAKYTTNLNAYNGKMNQAATAQQTADDHLSAYYGYAGLARAQDNIYNDYMQRACANLGNQGDGCDHGPYTLFYDPPEAQLWVDRAAPYKTERDRLDGIANTKYNVYVNYSGIANNYVSQAAQYEEGLSIYGAQFESHQNIQLGFQARRETYETQAAVHFGRWQSRSAQGTVCLAWAGDDLSSDSCVTQKGILQNTAVPLTFTATKID